MQIGLIFASDVGWLTLNLIPRPRRSRCRCRWSSSLSSELSVGCLMAQSKAGRGVSGPRALVEFWRSGGRRTKYDGRRVREWCTIRIQTGRILVDGRVGDQSF
jgi:hypothetical protein